MLRHACLTLLLCLLTSLAYSQTNLAPGDVVIVGYTSDNPDDFEFIPLVNLEAGTVIHFTDNGVHANGSFRDTEGVQTYTAPTAITVGTSLIYTDHQDDFESTGSGSFSLNASDGDQIIVFQGTVEAPVFIYALNFSGEGWQDDAEDANTSAEPPGLADFDAAPAFASKNGIYIGMYDLSLADLRASIAHPTNWDFSSTNIPLPVELTAIEALADGRAVVLAWTTAGEVNNAGFEVQHRVGAGSFEALSFVPGHGTTSEPQTYAFRAANLAPGRHTFRLKQIDFDGAFTYSPEVEARIDLAEAVHLADAYPNPFNPSTRFTVTVQHRQHVTVEVFNLLGQRVRALYNGLLEAGEAHPFTFDAADLPSGLYLYRVTGETFATTKQVTLLR